MNKYKITRWWHRVPRTLRWVLRHDARVVAHVIGVKTKTHSFFEQDEVSCMLYSDAVGGMWYRAWGRKKPEVPTTTLSTGTYIAGLGGGCWRQSAHDPDVFVCEFATTRNEMARTWTLPAGLVLQPKE